MKKYLVVSLSLLILVVFSACAGTEEVLTEPIGEVEESEEISFSQEDFILEIGTLPYQGAVLFITYLGDNDISDYELWVQIIYNEEINQSDIAEKVDDYYISPIIDLMYFPGDELEFVLIVKDEFQEWKYSYFQVLERYSFKDWMYEIDESAHVNPWTYNFTYHKGEVGAHSSWDIATDRLNAPVYSGTTGIVLRTCPDSVEIFNPHVGVVLQYGHVVPSDDFYEYDPINPEDYKNVNPGDYIGTVNPTIRHVHYSVIRPYKIGWCRIRESYWLTFHPFQEAIYDLKYYQDPFYFHEPTTLGYWYEETLPPGMKEDMIKSFQKYNPDVVLPATKPLNTD